MYFTLKGVFNFIVKIMINVHQRFLHPPGKVFSLRNEILRQIGETFSCHDRRIQ